jgi:hypothetical protein
MPRRDEPPGTPLMDTAMHLTPEEMIDLAEGTRAETTMPHVRACGSCRAQVAGLRAALAAAAQADVPEPPPLFWDELSARVRHAIAADARQDPPAQRIIRAPALPSWQSLALTGVAAAIMMAIYLTVPRPSVPTARTDAAAVTEETPALPADLTSDDPSLALVADLTSQLEPGAFDDWGWTAHPGAADVAIVDLTEGERLELVRLLREELGPS